MSRYRPVLLALMLGGCAGEVTLDEANPDEVRDQSGAVFAWDCSDDTRCRVERLDESPPLPSCEADEPSVYFYSWARFLTIDGGCVLPGATRYVNGWSRVVVCADDDECPQLTTYATPAHFECRAGFCQQAEFFSLQELPDRDDMWMLCVGAASRGEEPALDADFAAAFAAACPADDDSACVSLPPGCADPRG